MRSPLLWAGFNLFVVVAIALDLGVFHREARKISWKEAATSSALWIALALGFGYVLGRVFGAERGFEYLTGYVVEKALSVDNLFVFLLIFRTFEVPDNVQHRVLEWGILGALLMRGAMILFGAALVSRFDWILPLFGLFLVYAGLHMLWKREKVVRYERNPLFRFARSHLRVAQEFSGNKFFLRQDGGWYATPLLLVLLVVELADITFAVDSIPAIFGITREPFLVYSSNVFAILGLRALYFLLADLLGYLRYLGIGLGMILLSIGLKMVADLWWHISVKVSLGVVGAILLLTALFSIRAGPEVNGAVSEKERFSGKEGARGRAGL